MQVHIQLQVHGKQCVFPGTCLCRVASRLKWDSIGETRPLPALPGRQSVTPAVHASAMQSSDDKSSCGERPVQTLDRLHLRGRGGSRGSQVQCVFNTFAAMPSHQRDSRGGRLTQLPTGPLRDLQGLAVGREGRPSGSGMPCMSASPQASGRKKVRRNEPAVVIVFQEKQLIAT